MVRSTIPTIEGFDENAPLPPCPKCNTRRNVVKFGSRKAKNKVVKRFKCTKCEKTFSCEPVARTSYPVGIIAAALTHYDQGYTLAQTEGFIKDKYKLDTPAKTIYRWCRRYAQVCTFLRMRDKYEINPKTIVYTKRLYHQQVYDFRYHTLKTNIMGFAFPTMKQYLWSIRQSDDQRIYLSSKDRCSELKINAPNVSIRRTASNNATKMAMFAIPMARSRAQRHDAVERFFLMNDSTTFATEVPVYLTKSEAGDFGISIQENLTGHIDIIQYRNNRIYIMDFKPDQDPAQAAQQLMLYRMALSKRANIPIKDIYCAAFNETGYAEFQ